MAKTRTISGCFLALALASAFGCKSPYYADQLAGVGAVTGALAGAAIGDARGDAAAGALIGTAVGALGGAAIGDVVDQDIAASEAAIEAQLGRKLSGAVRIDDVIQMSLANLGDDVIITHIRAHGTFAPPSVDDLIVMRQQGVSPAVIQAYQQAQVAGTETVAVRRGSSAPVIVEEHYYSAPPWHHDPFHHHPRFCPPPRRRAAHAHWHFSFGH